MRHSPPTPRQRAAHHAPLRQMIGRALDLVLPPQCLCCGALIGQAGRLCAACWRDVTFIVPPFCALCGLPFDFDHGESAHCARCLAKPPPYRRARAVMVYDEIGSELIRALKYRDRLEGAPTFGAWLARAVRDIFVPDAIIAPVPLHRWRLFHRRFNQAALLAQAMAAQTDVPLQADLLYRVRPTPPQVGLTGKARYANVRGAFAVRDKYAALVQGRTVVLVDDVLTTGATVESSAHALHHAGAAAVDVVTLARVVHSGAPPI